MCSFNSIHHRLCIQWTLNACSDDSKCQMSISTLMTLKFLNEPNVYVPSIHFTSGFAPYGLNACNDDSKGQKINTTLITHDF